MHRKISLEKIHIFSRVSDAVAEEEDAFDAGEEIPPPAPDGAQTNENSETRANAWPECGKDFVATQAEPLPPVRLRMKVTPGQLAQRACASEPNPLLTDTGELPAQEALELPALLGRQPVASDFDKEFLARAPDIVRPVRTGELLLLQHGLQTRRALRATSSRRACGRFAT